MNGAQVQAFEFAAAGALRTIVVDGDPWFVAADVARLLGYRMASDMTRFLDDDEKGTRPTQTLGGEQQTSVISEPGLYTAIAQRQTGRMTDDALRSQVRSFQRWVTHDVLPAIRRTGSYATPTKNPADLSRIEILQLALAAEQENQVLQAALEEAAPAIAYHDRYVSRDDAVTVKVWAAQFGMTEPAARALMVDRKLIYRHSIGTHWSARRHAVVEEHEYRAYANHLAWFDLRPQHNAPRHHNGQVRQTLYVRQEFALEVGRRLDVQPVAVQGELLPTTSVTSKEIAS